ncbi:galectin-4-like isoform X2 [Corticium candelabrum]|uniref:galectin-4-like isoform X2 n=1 Tax=Corticium candelabrum TaxID=121492 RepID=UPI002E25E13D|nr:galectin-4-like isoform X2 [Corticium candelabrum]
MKTTFLSFAIIIIITLVTTGKAACHNVCPTLSRLLTIRPGNSIYVHGHVPCDSCNFDINLYTSPAGDNSDVALRIGVQFDAKAVILNSRRNGCWGRVITADAFPFESGKRFLLTITTTTRTYEVKVNGTLLHSFVHPLPLQCVIRFGINQAPCIGNLTALANVSLPLSRPYLTNAPGKTVYVYGVILHDPVHFDIDLFTTPEGDDSGIALHISVQSAVNAVFFNSKIEGVYGKQEKADTFPFQAEQKFLLTIATTKETYDIKVNETHLYSFNHRVQPQDVKRLAISQQSEDEGSWTLSSLEGEIIVFESRAASTVSNKYIKVKSDQTTVVTTDSTSQDKVQFTITGYENPYSFRNNKYTDKYLTIKENQLYADLESDYAKFKVTQDNEEYYIFESTETEGSYIGVSQSGDIVLPDEVEGEESNFYNGYTN